MLLVLEFDWVEVVDGDLRGGDGVQVVPLLCWPMFDAGRVRIVMVRQLVALRRHYVTMGDVFDMSGGGSYGATGRRAKRAAEECGVRIVNRIFTFLSILTSLGRSLEVLHVLKLRQGGHRRGGKLLLVEGLLLRRTVYVPMRAGVGGGRGTVVRRHAVDRRRHG